MGERCISVAVQTAACKVCSSYANCVDTSMMTWRVAKYHGLAGISRGLRQPLLAAAVVGCVAAQHRWWLQRRFLAQQTPPLHLHCRLHSSWAVGLFYLNGLNCYAYGSLLWPPQRIVTISLRPTKPITIAAHCKSRQLWHASTLLYFPSQWVAFPTMRLLHFVYSLLSL